MTRNEIISNKTAIVTLDKIVGGGQTLGTLEDGKKIFVWGGLPGETVEAIITKKKSSHNEGVVSNVITPSAQRVAAKDPESFISTSPWQIMSFADETEYKSQLIAEAFELHKISLEKAPEITTDGLEFGYRNKIEFSFWFDKDENKLSLAFFKRGTKGKIEVEKTSLAKDSITQTSQEILKQLNKLKTSGRDLKTLLIRTSQDDVVNWQLYVKNNSFKVKVLLDSLPEDLSERGEVIFSNPRSPASVITKQLSPKAAPLTDKILNTTFSYPTESFFQINLPVYQLALEEMAKWINPNKPLIDLYSGVGTIGLTIGQKAPKLTLVEINSSAVAEMKNNIAKLKLNNTEAVLAASEKATEHITSEADVILDPPRAGLHEKVTERLLEQLPSRIIYLSCNPTTQARDVMNLSKKYKIVHCQGFNFFPKTPHIENLVVLDKIS